MSTCYVVLKDFPETKPVSEIGGVRLNLNQHEGISLCGCTNAKPFQTISTRMASEKLHQMRADALNA